MGLWIEENIPIAILRVLCADDRVHGDDVPELETAAVSFYRFLRQEKVILFSLIECACV